MKNISKVNILAAQLRASDNTLTRSESMRTAWHYVKTVPEMEVITFKKVDGKTITTRVISAQWFKFQTPKGGESKLKEGQIVVADLAKFICGVPNCTISLYSHNILRRA